MKRFLVHFILLSLLCMVSTHGRAQSFIELGTASFQQGNLKQAERWFDWAIAADSTNTAAWMSRAQVRRGRNNTKGAYNDLQVLIEFDSSNGNAHFMLGLVAYQLGRYDIALDGDTRAIELGNSYGSQALMNRAQTYLRLGNTKMAIKDFSDVIKLKDQNLMNAFQNRGKLFLRTNEKRQALDDFKQVVKLDPTNLQLKWDVGQLAYQLEEYTDALTYYSKVLDNVDTPQTQMLLIRGEVFEKLEQYEAAIQDYSRVIQRKENLAQAYYLRGQANARSGSKNEACVDWKKAAELGNSEAKSVIIYNCK